MITSAKNTFHNNFIEYKLTGEKRYKNAADEAMNSIQKFISNLEEEVNKTTQIPVDFSSNLREKTIRLKNGRKRLIEEKDDLVEARMRTPQYISTLTSIDWRYYLTGCLVIVALLVKA
jgi:ElaB/YqjD/DUF883 family membrane-anchored ribosome-binding protein